jgi:hypothetical protein
VNADDERLSLLERAVRGLGREVEASRIAQSGLAAKTTVIDLQGQVAQLADQVADLPNLIPATDQSESYPVVSWLARLPDTFSASEVLAELIGWIRLVHLRYTDAASGLPECWLWHPEVVEELLWLMQAWRAAYLKPSIRAVGDWHDRLRPGVVRRITGYAGTCSLDNHLHHRAADPVLEVPTADAAEAIAAWWSGDLDRPAPEPTQDQIAAAFAAFNRRSRHQGGRS